MIRGNILYNNVAKLNTFIVTMKAQEQVRFYVNKICNKKCKSIKYITEFDCNAVVLLYLAMECNIVRNELSLESIDKDELNYYFSSLEGYDYVKKQLPLFKKEEKLIDYLVSSMADGNYVYQTGGMVKFDNELIIPVEWLISLLTFIVENFKCSFVKDKAYIYRIIQVQDGHFVNCNELLKNMILYEYQVVHKSGDVLSKQEVQYITDVLSVSDSYDFEYLKKINSDFAKKGLLFTVNKKNITLNQNDKDHLTMLLNENEDNTQAIEYVKQVLGAHNSMHYNNRLRMIQLLECLRACALGYSSNYSLEKMRSLFNDVSDEELKLVLFYVEFYLIFKYDSKYIKEYMNSSLFTLESIKPSIIDYETKEYKKHLKELSILNQKIVKENRKINRYLASANEIKKDVKLKKENEKFVLESSETLENLVKTMNDLRCDLEKVKKGNRSVSNKNERKLKYIEESLRDGTYIIDKEAIWFYSYDKIDAHRSFSLHISLKELFDVVLSEENVNHRINFYRL